MVLSNTSQRALFALQTHVGTMQNATRILSRGFATKLGNSMSDGNYESNVGQSSPGPDRPTSKDASVTRARAAQSSMTDPQMLANSLSDGVYPTNQHSRRRFDLSLGLSSISDPETFWAGSSMSDGYYEMPTALRAGPRSSKRSHVRHCHAHSL